MLFVEDSDIYTSVRYQIAYNTEAFESYAHFS